MLYSIMLFLHILGVIILFVAVGLTIISMIGMLNSKKTETIRIWATLAVKVDGLLPLSVIVIFFPALYLVINSWGWDVAWINLSLATLAIMLIMGPSINLRRLKQIKLAADAETSITPSTLLINTVQDRLLWISVFTMTALGLSIVFIMTVKLAFVGSLLSLATAIILGYLVSIFVLKRVATIN